MRRRTGALALLLGALLAGLTGCSLLGGTSGPKAAPTDSEIPYDPGFGPTTPPGTTTYPSPTATPKPTKPAPPPAKSKPAPAKPQPAGHADVAAALLAQINVWRADNNLKALTMDGGLVRSAHKHNLRMSAGCGLKHQCSGEGSLGKRISAEGVGWHAAAENIGTAWRISTSTSAILRSAKGLNTSMFNEKPPEDGHRRNILGKNLTRIGIDVIVDANGHLWLTEDFAG